MKSILLTGANGTLAKNFINVYSHKYNIISGVRNPKNRNEVRFNGWDKFNQDIEVDLVIHFAGKYLIDDSITSRKEVNDAVVGSSTSILEYCVSKSIPIVALGSYFEKAPSTNSPWSHYAIAKESARNLMKLASNNSGITVRYIYCYDTYGEDISRGKIIDVLLNEKTTSLALSPGQQKMNLTHEEDFSRAINLVAEETINGSSGFEELQIKSKKDEFTLQEIVEIVNAKRLKKIEINFGAKPYREKEAFSVWDCAPDLANWEPQNDFESFVEKFVKDQYAE